MNNKELKEVLGGLISIAGLLAEEFKDGVQATDFLQIVTKIQANEALKAKLLEAYNGIDQVPSEVKDLSVAETVDIMAHIGPELFKLIAAVKK
jgi:hypothetical protein